MYLDNVGAATPKEFERDSFLTSFFHKVHVVKAMEERMRTHGLKDWQVEIVI